MVEDVTDKKQVTEGTDPAPAPEAATAPANNFADGPGIIANSEAPAPGEDDDVPARDPEPPRPAEVIQAATPERPLYLEPGAFAVVTHRSGKAKIIGQITGIDNDNVYVDIMTAGLHANDNQGYSKELFDFQLVTRAIAEQLSYQI